MFFLMPGVCTLHFEGHWFKGPRSSLFSLLIWCQEVDVRAFSLWAPASRTHLTYLGWCDRLSHWLVVEVCGSQDSWPEENLQDWVYLTLLYLKEEFPYFGLPMKWKEISKLKISQKLPTDTLLPLRNSWVLSVQLSMQGRPCSMYVLNHPSIAWWTASWCQGGMNIFTCQLYLQHMVWHCIDT